MAESDKLAIRIASFPGSTSFRIIWEVEPSQIPSPSLLPLILFYVTFDPLLESKVTRKINQQNEGETGNEASGAWRLIGREYNICMAEVISTVHLNSLAVFITMSLSIHHQQLYYLPKC